MYAIYGNIYHQYFPNVSIYIPYMDPMGMCMCIYIYICNGREHVSKYGECWEIPKTEEWPSPGTEDRRLFSALNGVAGGT